jgi:subtilisin family serine protease
MSGCRRACAVALAALAAIPATAAAQRLQPLRSGPDAVPGQVVVQFDPAAGAGTRAQLRRAADAAVVRAMRQPGQQLLEVRDGRSVASVIRSLEADPRVVYAEPNHIYRAATTVPNDPAFAQLWGLRNTGQSVGGEPGGLVGADIDATSAWDLTTGSANVVVAVADTGIAYDHPDIAGNMSPLRGRDFIDGDDDPRDLNGHGTHVAGTIAAVGNNGVGTTGVSWDASLLAVRVLDEEGGGPLDVVADGLDYAGDLGVDIVNASLSGGGSALLQAAITSHPNTLFVVAAGNNGTNNDTTPRFPCNYTAANVICVAATTQADQLADFSNFGATSVDLGAPGTSILSAQPNLGATRDGFEANDLATRWVPGGWQRTSEAAASGSFSVTDSPGGPYPPNSNNSLRTLGRVNLSGEGCGVSYKLRLDSAALDGLLIETSPDGTTWTVQDGWSGSTGGAFDALRTLVDPLGPVFVRFRFVSNAVNQADGAHLDDIRIGCVLSSYVGDEYDFSDGTSMASPHVAGAAALILAARPSASVAQLRSALLSSGDPLPALTGGTVTGRRLDAHAALRAAGVSPPPQPIPTPPQPIPAAPLPPPVTSPPASPPRSRLGQVRVRCRLVRGRRIVCRLQRASTVRRATLRLRRGRRTVGRATVRPRAGTVSLRLPRRLRPGRYVLTLVLRDAAGNQRTLRRTVRV